MEDLAGKQLGQYRLIEPLGEGGMATVYKAYQPGMERYVALKILPRVYSTDPDFTHRFAREARVIASLEHPNILPVYEFGEAEGYTFLAMRLVETGTLIDKMQGKPLPLSEVVHVITQIASALDYAHLRGVVHRDVKPSNILVDAQGNCLLSDFGLAKVLLSVSMFTSSGTFLGTPKYASPEQCLGQEVDLRSDIYSLGVILFELVTGRPPFDAETPMGIIVKHIHDPLPLPRALNPLLPEAVERVILKALAKQPEDRFASAGEMAEALRKAVAESATAFPPKTLPVTLPRKKVERKRPALLWIGGVVLLIFLSALGCLAWLGSQWLGRIWVALVSQSSPGITAMNTPVATQSLAALPPTASDTPTVTMPSVQGTVEAAETEAAQYEVVPLWTSAPGEQHAHGEIAILEQFKAPGNQPTGLVWDGSHLWVKAEQRLLRIDSTGKTTALFSLDPIMPGGGYSLSGIAWVEDSFWVIDDLKKETHALKVEGDQLVETEKPTFPDLGTQTVSFVWDGETFWAVVGYSLYQFDASGMVRKHFISPYWLEGIAWDGRFLWVDGSSDQFKMESSGIYVMDTLGRTLASFAVSTPPYEIGEMTWDGKNLWVLGRTEWVGGQINLYRLGIDSALATAIGKAKLFAEKPSLFETLQCVPPLLSETTETKSLVKVINQTNSILTLTFETYNYSIQVAPGEAREIEPLEERFRAEAPGLPAVAGHYPFQYLPACHLAWIFEVSKSD